MTSLSMESIKTWLPGFGLFPWCGPRLLVNCRSKSLITRNISLSSAMVMLWCVAGWWHGQRRAWDVIFVTTKIGRSVVFNSCHNISISFENYLMSWLLYMHIMKDDHFGISSNGTKMPTLILIWVSHFGYQMKQPKSKKEAPFLNLVGLNLWNSMNQTPILASQHLEHAI